MEPIQIKKGVVSKDIRVGPIVVKKGTNLNKIQAEALNSFGEADFFEKINKAFKLGPYRSLYFETVVRTGGDRKRAAEILGVHPGSVGDYMSGVSNTGLTTRKITVKKESEKKVALPGAQQDLLEAMRRGRQVLLERARKIKNHYSVTETAFKKRVAGFRRLK